MVDVDLDGVHSSTLKNAGGVRSTWRNRANIELTKYSIDYFRTVKDEVGFRELGYFWLHDESSWQEMLSNYPLYEEYGLPVELYAPEDVPGHLPFVDSLEGIAGLSISRHAGLIDPYLLREHYRRSAKQAGVSFLDGSIVVGMSLTGGRVADVTILRVEEALMHRERAEVAKRYLLHGSSSLPGEVLTIPCGTLINTAGAWAPRVSALYGLRDESVRPRRRQMALFHCPDVDLSCFGMVIDTSDVYFHQEGDNILAGYSNMDEPFGYNLDYDFGGVEEGSSFVSLIWTPLYARSSLFERVKFIRGWAGLYAETPDRSGFLGRVPGFENLYECSAHTGRGVMVSYGAAVALADIIADGRLRPALASVYDLSRDRPRGALYEELHL